MRVAVIQFQIHAGDVAHNQKTVEKYIRLAKEKGAELLLLPELWNTGYDLENLKQIAEPLTGKSIKLLQKLALELDIFIIGGSISEKKEGRYYNTAVVINQKGEIITKYRKIHLFSFGMHEDQYFSPGDEWVIFDTPWIKAGLIICYDLRFPELIRNLTLRGAELIFVPAEWPKARVDNWRVLCQARAIENQCFLVSANATGVSAGTEFSGNSMIISPIGDILNEGGSQEGVYLSDLNMNQIEEIKSKINIFNDRKRIIDEIDDNQI